MNIKAKLLLSAVMVPALVTSTSAYAGDSQTILPQTNNLESVVIQDAFNEFNAYSNGNILITSIPLIEGEVTVDGNTQFALSQFNVIGAGTGVSASFASALPIDDASIIVDQALVLQQYSGSGGYSGFAFPGVAQEIYNNVYAESVPEGRNTADVTLKGISQIGVNQQSVASVSATNINGAEVLIEQTQQYPVSTYYNGYDNSDDRGGVFAQYVENSIVAELDGNGNVVIDGAYKNRDGDDVSAVQLGSNTLNAAYVSMAAGGDLALSQSAGYDYHSYGSGGYAYDVENYGGYSAGVRNEAVAWAEDLVAPRGGVVFDPAVRNLNQVATTSVNTLNVESGEDFTLHGASSGSGGYGSGSYPAQNFMFGGMSEVELGNDEEFYLTSMSMSNYALAKNGTEWGYEGSTGSGAYGGGYGNSDITDVSQDIVLSVNTVNIVGELDGETDVSRDNAGVVTLGKTTNGYNYAFVQQAGGSINFEDAFDASSNGGPLGYDYDSPWETYDDNAGSIGNAAVAIAGVGNASVNNVDQLQAVTVNSFTTSGDVVGASTELLATPYQPDLVQVAGVVDVELQNLAAAAVIGNEGLNAAPTGNVAASGSQVLSFALNTVSIGGNASGILTQAAGTEDEYYNDGWAVGIHLTNNMGALTSNGSATIGNPAGSGSEASPVVQTILSSVNTVALGSASNLMLTQQTVAGGYIHQDSTNSIVAGAMNGVNAANITQTVINRMNTISAIIPATIN